MKHIVKRNISIIAVIGFEIISIENSKLVCQPQINLDSGRTSVTIGYSENDFHFVTSNTFFTYDFQASFPVLQIGWKSIGFSIGYGKQSVKKLGAVPPMNMLEARLNTAGKINFFTKISKLELAAYMPYGMNLRYCNLSVIENIEPVEIPDLKLLNTDLGIGLGLSFKPEFIKNVLITYSVVSSIGGIFNFDKSSDGKVLLSRSFDMNFQVQIETLFKGLGLTLGYNFTSQRWTDESPESGKKILNSIISPGEIARRRGQNIYYIGINW